MGGLILVLILLLYIIYFCFQKVSYKINNKFIYVLGVYSKNKNDKKFAQNIIKLAEERDIDIILKEYDTFNKMIEELNNTSLDFAIMPEEKYSNSYLGLNEFNNKKYVNNQFVVGINFNYFYLISDIFYKDENKNTRMTNFSDIVNFKKINKRNYIVGTEGVTTYSYLFLIILLRMYGLKAVDINKANDNLEDNVVLVVTNTKKNLYSRFMKKKLDGIFLIDIYHSRFVSQLVQNSDAIFVNFDLQENTVFDQLLSNYFTKEKIGINSFYSNKISRYFSKNNITSKDHITFFDNDDLDEDIFEAENLEEELNQITSNLGVFETRRMRNCLITNNKISDDVIYNLVNIIIRNNNFLLNKVYYNKFSNTEHSLFEPVDIIYLNENLPYHKGSKKFFEEMKFISYNKKDVEYANANSDEKYDYYWKYSKIGMKQFKFDN